MLYFVRHGSTELNANSPQDPKNYFRGYLEASLDDIAKTNDISNWRLDPGLITWNTGVYAGHEVTKELLDSLLLLQRVHRDEKIPQGESYNDFLDHWGVALKKYIERSKTKDIVLISHHWNALAVPVILRGMKPEAEGPPENAGVIRIYSDGFIRELFTPPATLEAQKSAKGEDRL